VCRKFQAARFSRVEEKTQKQLVVGSSNAKNWVENGSPHSRELGTIYRVILKGSKTPERFSEP
jgi:hypothetical protein